MIKLLNLHVSRLSQFNGGNTYLPIYTLDIVEKNVKLYKYNLHGKFIWPLDE